MNWPKSSPMSCSIAAWNSALALASSSVLPSAFVPLEPQRPMVWRRRPWRCGAAPAWRHTSPASSNVNDDLGLVGAERHHRADVAFAVARHLAVEREADRVDHRRLAVAGRVRRSRTSRHRRSRPRCGRGTRRSLRRRAPTRRSAACGTPVRFRSSGRSSSSSLNSATTGRRRCGLSRSRYSREQLARRRVRRVPALGRRSTPSRIGGDLHVDRAGSSARHVVGEPGARLFAYEHSQPRVAGGAGERRELVERAAHRAQRRAEGQRTRARPWRRPRSGMSTTSTCLESASSPKSTWIGEPEYQMGAAPESLACDGGARAPRSSPGRGTRAAEPCTSRSAARRVRRRRVCRPAPCRARPRC